MSPAPTISLASFTSAVQSLLASAETVARQLHLDFVETEHLLAAMLDSPDPGVQAALRNAHVDPQELKAYLANYMEPSAVTGQTTPAYSMQVKQAVTFAVEEAQKALLPQAGPMQVLLGLVRVADGRAARALARFQVTQASLAGFSAPEPTPGAVVASPVGVATAGQPMQAPSQTPAQSLTVSADVPSLGVQGSVSVQQAPAAPQATVSPAESPQTAETPSEAPATPPAPSAPVAATGVLANYTTPATNVLSAAAKLVHDRKLTIMEPEFVLLAFAQGADASITGLFRKLNVDAAALAAGLDGSLERGTREVSSLAPAFSPRMKRVLEGADGEAKAIGTVGVDPIHIMLALLRLTDGLAADMLKKLEITYDRVRTEAPSYTRQAGNVAGIMTSDDAQSSVLTKFGEDLTEKARQGKLDAVIGRQHEIEQCVSILSRRLKNNPIILGEAGVGKTALVEGLAQLIVAPNCPDILKGKRIMSINMTSMISGASHRGEFEERMESLIKEVKQSNGEIILFIDEIHTLLGGGGGDGSMSAANILKPALSRGEIRLIGATTTSEFKKSLEKDPALQRRFQKVTVEPPSVEVTVRLLSGLRPKYESYHHVQIPDKALESAALLSDRYIHERFLPDKAVDLIDQAAADKHLPALSIPQDIVEEGEKVKRLEEEVATLKSLGAITRVKKKQRELDESKRRITDLQQQLVEREGSSKNATVTEDDIMRVISTMTGIPVSHLRESEADKLLHMEERIHERVIGQESAIHAISEAVRRGKAGLKNKNQPIGSFIFLGPTGVGKTELAKSVAEFLFGTEQSLIRFDMSEFQEKHSIARLIGAPPGYVGYDEGGQLTEAVRARPYSVVLFDELEKAHSDIFDILLQLLDDGRLTDSQGRTVDFKNTIVICTSNIGARNIQEKLGLLTAPIALENAETETEPKKVSITQIVLSYREAFGAPQTVLRTSDEALKLATELKQRAALPDTDFVQLVRQYSDDSRVTTGMENEGRDGIFVDASYGEKDPSKNSFPHEVSDAIVGGKVGEIVGPVQSVLGYHLIRIDKKEEAAELQAATELQAPSSKPQGVPTSPTDEPQAVTEPQAANLTPQGVPTSPSDGSQQAAGPASDPFSPFPEPALPAFAPLPAGMKGGIITPEAAASMQHPSTQLPQAPQAPDAAGGSPFPDAAPTGAEPAADAVTTPATDAPASSATADAATTGAPAVPGADAPAGDATTGATAPSKEEPKKLDPEEERRKGILADLKKIILVDLQKFMRPEMVNRFDEVVMFEPLTLKQISGIVSLIIAATQERLAEQSIFLEVTDEVKEQLAKHGFDPMFGARPLKRTCQKEVDNVLSTLLINGTFKTHDVIQAVLEDGVITFHKKEIPPPLSADAQTSTDPHAPETTTPAAGEQAPADSPDAATPGVADTGDVAAGTPVAEAVPSQAPPAPASSEGPASPDAVIDASTSQAPPTPLAPAPAAGGFTFEIPAPVTPVPGMTADQNPTFSSELPPGRGQATDRDLVSAFPSENPPRSSLFQE